MAGKIAVGPCVFVVPFGFLKGSRKKKVTRSVSDYDVCLVFEQEEIERRPLMSSLSYTDTPKLGGKQDTDGYNKGGKQGRGGKREGVRG